MRWGVLGGSSAIANFKMFDVLASTGELVAVASRNKARADEARRRAGAARAYGNYAELLSDRDVDAVYIALPNSLHGDWSIYAAEAGKSCLCEKPAFLDVDTASRVSAAVAAAGTRWMEGFMYRFLPHQRWLADGLEQEVWGAVRTVHASIGFALTDRKASRWSFELGGGSLADLGSYAVDAVRSLAGGAAGRVVGLSTIAPEGIDVRTAAVIQFGERLGIVDCDLEAAHHQRIVLACDDAVVVVEPAFNPGPAPVRVEIKWLTGRRDVCTFPDPDPYAAMVEAFESLGREGTERELAAASANAELYSAIRANGGRHVGSV